MKPFKILQQNRALWEEFYKVMHQKVEFPDGTQGDWWIKISPDAVIVIPQTKDGQILFQKNYKHGCGEIIVEFCAGMIEEGESALEAAKRELLEETGYEAESYQEIGQAFCNPTSSKMRYHFVLAKNIKKTKEATPEKAEQIEPFLVENFVGNIVETHCNASLQKTVYPLLFDLPTSTATLTALWFLKQQ